MRQKTANPELAFRATGSKEYLMRRGWRWESRNAENRINSEVPKADISFQPSRVSVEVENMGLNIPIVRKLSEVVSTTSCFKFDLSG